MPTPESKRRWYRLSPDRFVLGLLLALCLLWLSDRFQWFGFNHHKGWTVLIAVAAIGAAALVMLLWFISSLLIGWRFQFGIRSLLVFCLASSVVAGWLAVELQQARRQAEVVEWIESSGGWVQYDWEFDAENNPIRNSEPPEPRWLRNMSGDNFFSTVVAVGYFGNNITDAGLERLTGLGQLQRLILARTQVTDAGLEHLKGLTQLRLLYLSGTKITDAGLKHLKGLTQLRTLDLAGTNVTDVGLEHLKGLTQLRVLSLTDTKITDAGLEHLEGLTQLRELSLHDTKITDAGLEHLKGLTQLRGLSLYGTKITDAGLEHIKGLTRLRSLTVSQSRITDAGVERLQHSLPNCKIYH